MEQWKKTAFFLSFCGCPGDCGLFCRSISGKLCESFLSEALFEKNLKKFFTRFGGLLKTGKPDVVEMPKTLIFQGF